MTGGPVAGRGRARPWCVAWVGCRTRSTTPSPTGPRPDASARGLPVDWELASRTAARLMSPGPAASRAEAVELVTRLRADAAVAEGHVREVTGLGHGLPLLPADVVDRPAWAAAAVHGMQVLTAGARLPEVSAVARAVTARTAGLQLGGVVAYLGGRVLGQYDPFGGPGGRRPAAAGRARTCTPRSRPSTCPSADFGLWVCLHEATHRLQFTAVPWLRSLLRRRGGPVPVDRPGRRGRAGRGGRRCWRSCPRSCARSARPAATRWPSSSCCRARSSGPCWTGCSR